MADASSSSGGLLGLPSCVMSTICNQLQAAEQGALRQVCSGLSCTVDSVLQSVSCSADIQQLSFLLIKLKGLKHLTVEGIGYGACGASPYTLAHPSPPLSLHACMWLVRRSSGTHSCYAGLHYHAPDLVASLSALTALTSITLTSAAAAQLGALKWAGMEAESAVAGSTGANAHGSSQQESSLLPSALDDFFWVPDWLASAPSRCLKLWWITPDPCCSADVVFCLPLCFKVRCSGGLSLHLDRWVGSLLTDGLVLC